MYYEQLDNQMNNNDNNNDNKHVTRWRDLGIKDKLGYLTAIVMIASGIVMGFLCVVFNEWDINTGPLIYIAQSFLIGGAILGANLYFRTKWVEFDNRAKKYIDEEINKEIHNNN